MMGEEGLKATGDREEKLPLVLFNPDHCAALILLTRISGFGSEHRL